MQFVALKEHFQGRRSHNNEKAAVAVPESLRMQERDLYRGVIIELLSRCD
jgi:hypothetical protein